MLYIKVLIFFVSPPLVIVALLKIKRHWIQRVRKEQLLFVVRYSSAEFLKQYSNLDLPSLPQFNNKNIIKALEIASKREDGTEMAQFLFPRLISFCFRVTDPQHVDVRSISIINSQQIINIC